MGNGEKDKKRSKLSLLISIGLITLVFLFGVLLGAVLGYKAGMETLAKYFMQVADKVNVDKVEIGFNETIITDAVERLESLMAMKVNVSLPVRQAYYYDIDNESAIYTREEGSGDVPVRIR